MARTEVPARGWTEEELALLGHSDLAEDRSADVPGRDRGNETYDESGRPRPIGFRERLALGDLSW
jgi:hypothetical protein